MVHQIRANDIYFSLSEIEKATWVIGDVLEKTTGRQAPDASYVSDDGEVVHVEVDTGHYKRHQVLEKLGAWSNTRQVWVCPTGREQFLRRCGVRDVQAYVLPRKEVV